MPSLYVAAYLAYKPSRCISDTVGTAANFYAAAHPGSGFPYDAGDDPAFFCACHHGGPITWGVCR